MKKIILSIYIVFTFRVQAFTQNVICEIRILNDSIGLIDPFQIEISIINNSNGYIKNLLPLINDGIKFYFANANLEYKKTGDTTWSKIEFPSRRLYLNYHGTPFAQLEPGNRMNAGLIKMPNFLIGERDVLRSVQIRVSLQPQAPSHIDGIDTSPIITSKENTVFFKRPLGQDQFAYEILEKTSEPDFMFKPYYYGLMFYDCTNEEGSEIKCPNMEMAEKIVTNFPNSKFAPWCRLYLAINYNNIAASYAPTDSQKANEYLTLSYKNLIPVLKNDNAGIKELSNSLLTICYPETIRNICLNSKVESPDCFNAFMRGFAGNH